MVAHDSRTQDLGGLLEAGPPDQAAARLAQQIALSLSIRRRRRARDERGNGPLASLSYQYRSDDIDIDRTLEALTEHPFPDETDIVVRDRTRSTRAAALIIDVSGSMRGEKVRMAAATVAALAAEFRDDQLTVIAFWSDAALVKPLNTELGVSSILDQLLRIPTRGLTNVAFGLETAAKELSRSRAVRRVGVLLTDALHNAGDDPRLVSGRFPELHVLAQTDGSHDLTLATDIARHGHGRVASAKTHRDISPALNRLLAL